MTLEQATSGAGSDVAEADEGPMRSALAQIRGLLSTILAMSGFVPAHASVARATVMSASVALCYYLSLTQPGNQRLAVLYAVGSIVGYVGFISVVLPRNGLRLWFVKRWGEERGYLAFEAILGFLFFHNAAAIGYVASSAPGRMLTFLPREVVVSLAAILFVVGLVTKLWAATSVSVDVYYWKDMFLGRKVGDFVATGPYRFLKNPMYGVGQLQAYSLAIWLGSPAGLAIAFLNQCSVFLFHFAVEEPFVQRTHNGQDEGTESRSR
jgi:protein-S-isoprenylcysteine O-methyltransferase Ste14